MPVPNETKAIADRVAQAARDAGWSQADIARFLELPESQISRRFHGRVRFRATELAVLGPALGADVAWFLLGDQVAA